MASASGHDGTANRFRPAIPLIAALLLWFPAPVFSAGSEESPPPTAEVLAQVGEARLTAADFQRQIQALPPHVQAMVRADKRFVDQLLQQWVRRTLLAREAETAGLDRLADVEARVREFRDQLLAEELLANRLKTATASSEEECRAYFNTHPESFRRGEEVKIAQILFVLPENASAAMQENVAAKADRIRGRLALGESFEDLARTYSDDNVSKHQGGVLGFFGRGKLLKEFEEAAFSTPVGEVSPPVRTAMGIHLVKVLGYRAARLPAYEEVRDEVREQLRQEKRLAAEEKLLEELKVKFPVTFPSANRPDKDTR